jgi:hypothetical protein
MANEASPRWTGFNPGKTAFHPCRDLFECTRSSPSRAVALALVRIGPVATVRTGHTLEKKGRTHRLSAISAKRYLFARLQSQLTLIETRARAVPSLLSRVRCGRSFPPQGPAAITLSKDHDTDCISPAPGPVHRGENVSADHVTTAEEKSGRDRTGGRR